MSAVGGSVANLSTTEGKAEAVPVRHREEEEKQRDQWRAAKTPHSLVVV
jgi:hypothetical protein